MKKASGQRFFIYFLTISFLLMMNGVPAAFAAPTRNIPVGEMVSRGEVKYEARENVWKPVERSNFSIFMGTKIKTEKGLAVVTLADESQIKVAEHTAFFFDPQNHLVLSKGTIEFRLPSSSQVGFRIGDLAVLKAAPLQAAKDISSALSKNEETLGSIAFHSNGAVTISTVKGKLSVLNSEHEVLAGLSSNDSITLPSTTFKERPPVRVAQLGEGVGGGTGAFLGAGAGGTLLAVAGGTLALGGVVYGVDSTNTDEGDHQPVCP